MRVRLVCFLLCVMLSGCAGLTFKQKLKPLVGQPANAMIAKLGFPDRQDQIAGKKVYVWAVSGASEGTTYSCTIRAILGDGDIIENIDWGGNEGACENYSDKLIFQH
jgi:hypothetical protein